MTSPKLRAAIVGAGPSGFYTAAELVKALDADVTINLIDRLPTPYGLVRAGVAPDHPRIKSVATLFAKTAAHPAVRYFGGVEVGRDITSQELREHHDAVVYTIGAPVDRGVGIPGWGLPGSFGAAQFVGWYNGHPDHRELPVDLNVERAVVIGNGNVALDIARILTLPVDDLARTDIADHALEALARSRIREVVVLGRRGPAQAAWTTPELLELGGLPGIDIVVEGLGDPAALRSDTQARNANSIRANIETVLSYADRTPLGSGRTIRLRFCTAPLVLTGVDRASGVIVNGTRLHADDDGRVSAELDESRTVLDAGLIVAAIGHRSTPPIGLPYDAVRKIVRNIDGRISDGEGRPIPGLYVAGWAKRGPSGVIGTNKQCATATVRALLADRDASILPLCTSEGEAFTELCRSRAAATLTDWDGWGRLDRAEIEAGRPCGRPRVKFTDPAAMRRFIDVADPVKR